MKINKILIIILFLAFLLRIAALENVPSGFYKDEAFIGFDVFSLLETGKDVHGNPWPLYFEDSGDWRNPVYYYAAIPSIAFFGLNVFAARLPAVFFGLISVLTLFLMARELLNEKKALFASALLAISPWSLMFSRIAFEAAALPALFLTALWLFLRGFRHPNSWIASAVFFTLCLYTYITAPIFIPAFLAALFLIYRKKISDSKKYLIYPIIIFLALSLPLVLTAIFSSDTFFARSNAVSIFSAPNYSAAKILANYLQYYSIDFLFMNGDHNWRMSVPGYGKLLWFMAPLVIAGFYTLLRSLKTERTRLLIAWFVLFPIAGIFTTDAPYAHSTRAIVGIGLFEILATIGAFYLFDAIKKHSGQRTAVLTTALLLFASVNTVQFLKNYFFIYPIKTSEPVWFQDGLKEAFGFIEQNRGNYDHVILSPDLDNAKIYAAFYLKTDPREVQTDQEKISQCRVSDCELKGKLLLLKLEENLQEGSPIKTIKNKAGENVFRFEVLNIK